MRDHLSTTIHSNITIIIIVQNVLKYCQEAVKNLALVMTK